jgi:Cytochrome bd terminal oxidase subunit I
VSALILSRLQFAFTMGYHILWPTFTIGIASFVMCLSGLWWWTGRTVYRDLMRFWSRVFAMGFGMGVITGVVLSYEIGTNWSGFSQAVSNVLGPLFIYEAAKARFSSKPASLALFSSVKAGSDAGCISLRAVWWRLAPFSARSGCSPQIPGCRRRPEQLPMPKASFMS